jgi:oligoribonuclease NrnB/cAMP/cGMP phosphodiesterase (DHH superfamily)
MKMSFRDYVTISDAFIEAQLDEGKIWDAIKAKLGGKATDDEIEAEIERLKKTDKKDLDKIAKSSASRDFHERKKQAAMAKKPQGTIGHEQPAAEDSRKRLGSMQSKDMRAGHARAAERNWAMGEEIELTEGVQEFVVSYTSAGGGSTMKAKIKGRDIREVRRKFNDSYFKKQILGIEPSKGGKKVPMKRVPESPDMDD